MDLDVDRGEPPIGARVVNASERHSAMKPQLAHRRQFG
jgi:hypothetical protein